MAELDDEHRRALLASGRALPPDPGRFPLRAGNAGDVQHAAADVDGLPDAEQAEVRAHIVQWAVHDGTTEHLPTTWHIQGA